MTFPTDFAHRIRWSTVVAAGLLGLFSLLALVQPHALHYPLLKLGTQSESERVDLSIIMEGHANSEKCKQVLNRVATNVLTACPQCQASLMQCSAQLTPEIRELMSDKPLDHYSIRFAEGVCVYKSGNIEAARNICQETERKSVGTATPVKCYAPGDVRPVPEASTSRFALFAPIPFGVLMALIALSSSAFVGWLIWRFQHLHRHFSLDHIDSGPQKYHDVPTPRIGGLALAAGMMIASSALVVFEAEIQPIYRFTPNNFILLLIAGLPAFLGGLYEDCSKRVSVLDRLLLTMASGAFAAWVLGATLNRLEIPVVDALLMWLPLALLFTTVAVGGVANSINIIDGYNGLAGGYAFIVLIAFAIVSYQTNDTLLLHVSLSLMGALLGFLIWNWPGGSMFLGDGGAYLLGFLLAELGILITLRNPEVSAWFPLLLVVYPVFETLFSIFRRKFGRGHHPGHPDALHLHQLVYHRLVRVFSVDRKLERNSSVAPYFWAWSTPLVVVGVLFYHDAEVLMATALAFCLSYIWLYWRLRTWRAPKFLIKKS